MRRLRPRSCATLSFMPFTFLAHQAPVLPIKARRPDRWDGLALVVGSMAPDLAYVVARDDRHYFDGHRLQNQLTLMVFAIAAHLRRAMARPARRAACPARCGRAVA